MKVVQMPGAAIAHDAVHGVPITLVGWYAEGLRASAPKTNEAVGSGIIIFERKEGSALDGTFYTRMDFVPWGVATVQPDDTLVPAWFTTDCHALAVDIVRESGVLKTDGVRILK